MKYSDVYIEDLGLAIKQIPNLKSIFKKKVLVTGATGMVGSGVVDMLLQINRMLDAGIAAFASSRSKEKLESRFGSQLDDIQLKYVSYDSLLNNTVEEEFDFVIHAAAPANPKEYGQHPVETIDSIITGTSSMLRTSKRCGAKRFMYISSSEVYGIKEKDRPYEEKDYGFIDLLNSRSCYPMAKRAAETLCVSFSKEYEMPIAIARLGHIYGPTLTLEDNRVAADFVRLAVEGKDIVLKSKGEQKRSHCYIVDCASAILTILINGDNGAAYNISNPTSISTIKEYAECVCKHTGSKIIFDLPTTAEAQAFNPMQNASLSSDLLEGLGWKGLFDLETGVGHTVEILKRK